MPEFQWKINGVDISGATTDTYIPQVEDEGKSLTVTYTPTTGSPITSTPVTVTFPTPVFFAQPTLSASSYTTEDTVTITLGTTNYPSNIVIEEFSLNGVNKLTELSGTTWNPAGESGGTISYRTRATNSGGSVLSNTITATLFPSLPADLAYTQSVTSTGEMLIDGTYQLTVTSPAQLAAYGDTNPGSYSFNVNELNSGPVLLYPGEFSNSQPTPGGEISMDYPAWLVGRGSINTFYRVMLGSTQKATIFPFDTTGEAAGNLYDIYVDATDENGTKTYKLATFTLEESGAAPFLQGFDINYSTNTVSFNSSLACDVTWGRYILGHSFTNPANEVLNGTGAIQTGTFPVVAGPNTIPLTFTGGVSGLQELYFVGRVGAGPLSGVVGSPVDITPSGSSLTSPLFRASTFGGSAIDVSATQIVLPAYNAGDLVILPVGVDYLASGIAGVTAVGPNGEVATVKRTLTGTGSGASEISLALLYYRATAANTSGAVTISITAGGVKNSDQIICTPNIRYNVKASGDPFGQVQVLNSATAQSTAQTSTITAVSAASRIEAVILNDATTPSGVAPDGWFMREFGLLGSQAIQLMSRNTAVESAGQSIPSVSVSLGTTPQPWVGYTWELLPLGA